jgi:hypothetical protein
VFPVPNGLLDRYPHPGKFEGEINLTERLYELSLESGQDEELGDVDTFGHYMLFTGLDNGEFGHLGGIKAAILHTGSSGFVGGTYYEDEGEARQVWAKLEEEYSQINAEEED